ncbi:MAG: hypothetical protein JXR94_12205 [Candidatus Hydrogenedentes bacterium]|nr:hypothetical protein [Candidatus Hydrogenedentota bacterium]
MTYLVTVALACALSQAPAPDAAKLETYRVVLKSGDVFYGIEQRRQGDVIVYEYDHQPGKEGIKSVRKSEVDFSKTSLELSSEREQRILAYWADLGRTKVVLPDGTVTWQPVEEVELVARAKKMAAERDRAEKAGASAWIAEASAVAEPPLAPEPEEVPPGVLALWGPQIVLALAAMALVGLIAKRTLFTGGDK